LAYHTNIVNFTHYSHGHFTRLTTVTYLGSLLLCSTVRISYNLTRNPPFLPIDFPQSWQPLRHSSSFELDKADKEKQEKEKDREHREKEIKFHQAEAAEKEKERQAEAAQKEKERQFELRKKERNESLNDLG